MIEFKNVTKVYKNGKGIFNIDLQVESHTTFALVGANGAGKSTLLKCLVGAINTFEGEITIDGRDARTIEAKRLISYLPEVVEPPLYLKGIEYIEFIVALSDKEVDQERLETLTAMLEFEGLDRQIRSYSKGMRQKLSLIATILCDTPWMILDEPMSGLDPIARRALKEIFSQLQGKRGIFFASHILADVEELAQEVAIIDRGTIIDRGRPEELKEHYRSATLEEAFMRAVR
ncbi:MAG: ABC transporter ATP-binding protein [Epsilonproteobacteria bacterium]|nr:ABC transporter ATP-binding protein [Campylobacterota bacterium]NPA56407.1 ABC transporter ATP-binding protein [Campylobacterota bacterium]